jgi:nucleotide-binding universal stress UspA family protein
MSSETAKPATPHLVDPDHLFDRVLCGVNGSDESTEAVVQANALAPTGAQFTIFGIVDTVDTTGGVAPYGSAYTLYQEGIEQLVREAARSLSARTPRPIVVDGPVIPVARELLEKERATLVAVGASHANRAWGVVLGSLATELTHAPRTPVLLARKLRASAGEFPRTIVVGYDGSAPSQRAMQAAEEIGPRLGRPVTVLVVGDGSIRRPEPTGPTTTVSRVDGDPATALSSTGADLTIVGSSRRTGVDALSSVSERVAHHAAGSVLVIP